MVYKEGLVVGCCGYKCVPGHCFNQIVPYGSISTIISYFILFDTAVKLLCFY